VSSPGNSAPRGGEGGEVAGRETKKRELPKVDWGNPSEKSLYGKMPSRAASARNRKTAVGGSCWGREARKGGEKLEEIRQSVEELIACILGPDAGEESRTCLKEGNQFKEKKNTNMGGTHKGTLRGKNMGKGAPFERVRSAMRGGEDNMKKGVSLNGENRDIIRRKNSGEISKGLIVGIHSLGKKGSKGQKRNTGKKYEAEGKIGN